MSFTVISVEPRKPYRGQKITMKIDVRSEYSFPHPFIFKVISEDGTTILENPIGVLRPHETKVVELKIPVETDKEVFRIEVSLWVEVEGLLLLDDVKKFAFEVREGRRWLRWLLRR